MKGSEGRAEGSFADKATLEQAINLVSSGQIDAALRLCRECVARNPLDVNMLALLGATLFKSREPREAEQHLRKVNRLAPRFAKPWADLGHLLLETGRPDEARQTLEHALSLEAADAQAWFNLGRARAVCGDGAGADRAFERCFELDPERKALALAAEQQQQGRWAEAEAGLRRLLAGSPRNVDALRLLALNAIHAGRNLEAERLLRKAVEVAPDFVEARLDLGRLLREQQRLAEAVAQLRVAVRLEPGNIPAHFQLASALAPAAQTSDAIAEYRRVLELQPHHAGGWLGLGHALKTAGEQEQAIAAYRECIRLKPGQGETYWSLANLKTYKLSDADISAIEAQLQEGKHNGEHSAELDAANAAGVNRTAQEDSHETSRVNFQFALAKAFEDRGDFETAWRWYQEGNHTRRMSESYDPVRTETLNDELLRVFTPELLQRLGGQGHASSEPIFIVGLPRSGSTLLEQILASHSQVEGTAELPYVGMLSNQLGRNRADGLAYPQVLREANPAMLQRLGQEYLDLARIHRTAGTPRFIDKMPNNFPAIGFLHLMFPNCSIIDARRYPLDSTLSCYRQLFARGQSFTYDLTDIGEYFLQYQRMLDYWHEVLPGRVLTMQYEDVVTDLEGQVRRLLAHCRLPFEEGCLRYWETDRPVRTASSEQVRQPVYTRSIHHWRNYEQHLDELREVLEPVLPRYARYEGLNPAGGKGVQTA